jgi:hypothetical protein
MGVIRDGLEEILAVGRGSLVILSRKSPYHAVAGYVLSYNYSHTTITLSQQDPNSETKKFFQGAKTYPLRIFDEVEVLKESTWRENPKK